MKKFIAIILTVCLIIVFLIAFCLSNSTTKLNGTVVDKGKESYVNIVIKNKNVSKLFKKMHGDITINDGNNIEKYEFSGRVYDFHVGVNIVDAIGYIVKNGDGDFEFCRMYFDDDLKNIILILKEKEIYSAEEDFKLKVKDIQKNTKP